MRKDFNLMKDVSQYTRVGPAQRVAKLLAFNNRLQTSPASIQCYRDWGLNLDTNLVTVTARELPSETILLGGNST